MLKAHRLLNIIYIVRTCERLEIGPVICRISLHPCPPIFEALLEVTVFATESKLGTHPAPLFCKQECDRAKRRCQRL